MSCPDWRSLVALRDGSRGSDPEGWTQALAHFDSCSLCRRQALAADPTLVFRRMPVVELAPAREADEVAAVRQAVAAMRTASRLDAPRPLSFSGWKRWAAAAVLALASLSLGQDPGPSSSPAEPPGAALMPPAVEGVNLPDARVYQMGEGDFAVTMVFSESLDV